MRIARNAAISVGQVLISAGLLFVLYRSILRTLGADQLGIWSVVVATASASRIAEAGLSIGVTRFVGKYLARSDQVAAIHVAQTACLSIAALMVLFVLPTFALLNALFASIFSGDALVQARMLLPYALASLVIATPAVVAQSALDGCQRYDWRAFLVLGGQLFFLGAVLWFTPRYGLVGLAIAQVGQSLLLLVAGWLILRRVLPGLPWMPYQWRWQVLRKMLGYGLQIQIGGIAMMLFEPLTKALLGKYGGLSATAYYEMASQLIHKAHQLLVAANQVMLPVAAGLGRGDNQRLAELYETNLRLLWMLLVPLYTLVIVWAPLISEYWIGDYQRDFVLFAQVLALAWFITGLNVPAYIYSLGTGRVIWNTTAHVWIGLCNLALGVILGPHFGASGIILGVVVSLASGASIVTIGFQVENRLDWRLLLPRKDAGMIVVALTLIAASTAAHPALDQAPASLRLLLLGGLPLAVLLPMAWIHPCRPLMQGYLLAAFGKR